METYMSADTKIMFASIGCILTAYKRQHLLPLQLRQILNQTIRPAEIVIWNNTGKPLDLAPEYANILVVTASRNMGVWPRFMLGFELHTEYLCVFDDDTIPGKRWFENCIQSMKIKEGVYTACGVVFPNGDRAKRIYYGAMNPPSDIVEVDQGGHSLFFKRDWMRNFAYEPRFGNETCGEVYHISVAVQKQLGLGTYVPPYPRGNKELWGSLMDFLGNDKNALWKQEGEESNKRQMHNAYIANGWRPIALR